MYHFNLGGPLSFAFAVQLNRTQGQALKNAGVLTVRVCVLTLTDISSRTFVCAGHTTGVM